jgi:hypothetical protein
LKEAVGNRMRQAGPLFPAFAAGSSLRRQTAAGRIVGIRSWIGRVKALASAIEDGGGAQFCTDVRTGLGIFMVLAQTPSTPRPY